MTEISPIAPHRPPASRAALVARRPSTSRQIERPRNALAHQEPVADWRRLRTIVDALLHRAAASQDAAAAIGATNTTPEEQEPNHG